MFNEHENYEEELEVNTSNLDEESKVLKKNFIKILIELVISSLVYLISSACSKIGIMTSGFEVQNMIILKYAHYIMIVAYILSILGIILLILQLLKIQLPKININLSIVYVVLDWLALLPVCIAIATFCFTFIFTFTTVSGQSMQPNIQEGDRLLVTYPSEYKRFDVVVIKVDGTYDSVSHPDLYLKRIIGLPGDSIDYVYDEETNTTQLYVNGEVFNEYFYTTSELSKYPTFNTSDGLELFDWAEKCYTGYYPGRDYCDTKNGQIVIPDGYYFVLGDNRGVSKDSRNIGLVKEEDIIGKTKYIVNNLILSFNIKDTELSQNYFDDAKKYVESKMTVNEAWNGYVESLRTEDPREIDYWRNLFYTKAQLEKQRKGYI
jgi:signal peptidase I